MAIQRSLAGIQALEESHSNMGGVKPHIDARGRRGAGTETRKNERGPDPASARQMEQEKRLWERR